MSVPENQDSSHPGPGFIPPTSPTSPYGPAGPPRPASQRGPRPALVVVGVVLLAALGIGGYLTLNALGVLGKADGKASAGAPGPGASDGPPVRSSSPSAGPTDSSPSPESTYGLDEEVLTAKGLFGEEKTAVFEVTSKGRTDKATMLVQGTWDHRTCKGLGRSDRAKRVLEDGGCTYGVERDLEDMNGYFSIGNLILVFDSEEDARAAKKVLKGGDPEELVFRTPHIAERPGLVDADVFGRCVALDAVHVDVREQKRELSAERYKAFWDKVKYQIVTAMQFTITDYVVAHRMGGYQRACG